MQTDGRFTANPVALSVQTARSSNAGCPTRAVCSRLSLSFSLRSAACLAVDLCRSAAGFCPGAAQFAAASVSRNLSAESATILLQSLGSVFTESAAAD